MGSELVKLTFRVIALRLGAVGGGGGDTLKKDGSARPTGYLLGCSASNGPQRKLMTGDKVLY